MSRGGKVVSVVDVVDVQRLARRAKQASYALARAGTSQKNDLLFTIADRLQGKHALLLEENRRDLKRAEGSGMSAAMLDRLELTEDRLGVMAKGLCDVAALPDPVGEVSDLVRRPSGIQVGRMRIPFGLVAIIYESRPNVTTDAAALCLKSGNATILRGGSEAVHSNQALASVIAESLTSVGLPAEVVTLMPTTSREALLALLKLEELVDLVIPRGGEGLIRFVAENSRIPVIKHYKGTCHVYVDAGADLSMAVTLTINSKVQRPGVCNAAETLLVHQTVARQFLPVVGAALVQHGVELRGCPRTREILREATPTTEEDWPKEYLDLILSIKVVDTLAEAVEHIRKYGSQHTETIVTNDHRAAMQFIHEVDSSSVMINASTRFADGGEYGLGAEIGISTSKLHAYGPMGLRELTAQKFIVFGQGNIRI